MMEWQPIETAPLDESILVWFSHERDHTVGMAERSERSAYAENAYMGNFAVGEGIAVAKYVEHYDFEEVAFDGGVDTITVPGCWVVVVGIESTEIACNALFWMPLPTTNPFDEENV